MYSVFCSAKYLTILCVYIRCGKNDEQICKNGEKRKEAKKKSVTRNGYICDKMTTHSYT